MKTAVYPVTQQQLTVEQYVGAFGAKLDRYGKVQIRPDMVCVACNETMHTVGENGPLRDATWAHNPNPKGPWCVIKESSGKPYEVLTPTHPDPLAGAALRKSFFVNWRKHWGLARELAPMCDIITFIGFIKHADKKKLWEQRGLEEWFLPYIFLSTCEFPPPSSKKGASVRSEWLRFCFDSRIRTLDELWIRTTEDWRMLRVFYRSPLRGTTSPGASHFLRAEVIDPDPRFLSRTFQTPHPFQLNAMQKAFPTEPI